MNPETALLFGELLRRYRAAAGLTQEELAARSGLTSQGIGLLERGVRQRPQASTVTIPQGIVAYSSCTKDNLLSVVFRYCVRPEWSDCPVFCEAKAIFFAGGARSIL